MARDRARLAIVLLATLACVAGAGCFRLASTGPGDGGSDAAWTDAGASADGAGIAFDGNYPFCILPIALQFGDQRGCAGYVPPIPYCPNAFSGCDGSWCPEAGCPDGSILTFLMLVTEVDEADNACLACTPVPTGCAADRLCDCAPSFTASGGGHQSGSGPFSPDPALCQGCRLSWVPDGGLATTSGAVIGRDLEPGYIGPLLYCEDYSCPVFAGEGYCNEPSPGCFSLSSDSNCGSCGVVCPAGQGCDGGSCGP